MFSRRVMTAAHTIVLGMLNVSAACLPTPGVTAARPETDSLVQVGYGEVRRRSRVTGAIASLGRDEIDRSHAASMQDLLERLPGVEMLRDAGAPSVRVRGARREPLVVIDGTQLASFSTSALLGILPSDVDRIDVLKGIGATAPYGGRGENGVIIVTTRHRP